MDGTPSPRDDAFAVDDGFLVRRVAPARGTPYEHRCSADAFENIAWAIEEHQGPFTLNELQRVTELPFTQVAVALAFLKERGCITPVHGRKHKAASAGLHLDAMTEFHAQREGAPGA
jgi:hypothetical protein